MPRVSVAVALILVAAVYFANGFATCSLARKWPVFRILWPASLSAAIVPASIVGTIEFVTAKLFL